MRVRPSTIKHRLIITSRGIIAPIANPLTKEPGVCTIIRARYASGTIDMAT
jgi:hypothetical protein